MRDATESERQEFRHKFGIVGLVSILFGVVLVASTFLISLLFESQVVGWFALVLWGTLGAIWTVFRYHYLRCPHCKAVLWRAPGVCRNCGTRWTLFF